MSCRQPLGTSEHCACIGLAYINFMSCHCESKSNNLTQFRNSLKVKPAVTNAKRKLLSWLSTSETQTAEAPEKKPKASRDQDKDVKVIDSDVEEGGKNTNGADFVEPEQGGSCNPEHVESQANDDTRKEPASARSDLKRRSPDARDIAGDRCATCFRWLKGRNWLAAFVALWLALGFDELVGIYAGAEG